MTERQNELRAASDARLAWTAPEVRRLDAGSAEGGANNVPDGASPS